MNGVAYVAIGGQLLDEAIVQRVDVLQRLNDHWICEIECRDTMDRPIPGETALGAPCVLSNTAEDGTTYPVFSGTVIDVALKHEVWGSYSALVRAASDSWLMDHSPRLAYFGTSTVGVIAGQLGAALACRRRRPRSSMCSLARRTGSFCCGWRTITAAGSARGWVASSCATASMPPSRSSSAPSTGCWSSSSRAHWARPG